MSDPFLSVHFPISLSVSRPVPHPIETRGCSKRRSKLTIGQRASMTKLQRLRQISIIMLTLNVIGAVAYLWLASRGWRIPEEKGTIPVTGEPFVWAIGVFPIWAIFLLLNAIWGLLILRSRQWRSGSLWLLTLPIWLIAVVIDFAHH